MPELVPYNFAESFLPTDAASIPKKLANRASALHFSTDFLGAHFLESLELLLFTGREEVSGQIDFYN